MNGEKRARWRRRPGTIGGKLPWNDWCNASNWRKATQSLLLAISIYVDVTFYYWIRYFEIINTSVYIPRPGGIEEWLPTADLTSIRCTLETGLLPPIHTASMLLLVAFTLISLLSKEASCSWLCPVDTLSELLGNLGKKIFGHNFTLSRWLDALLLSLKYLLLNFFLYIAPSILAQGIQYFPMSAYGMIVDVKMFDFLRYIGSATLIFVVAISVLSLFVRNAQCHYLCSCDALFGLFSLPSPFEIRRNADSCIDCGKCAKNCPSHIPVDRLVQVRTMECIGCVTYVESCPVASTLSFSLQIPPGARDSDRPLRRQRTLPGAAMTLLMLDILFATIGYAVYASVWDTLVPDHMCFQLIPKAKVTGH